jgi:hypothetical protein
MMFVPSSVDIGKHLYRQSSCIEQMYVEAQRGLAKPAASLPAIRTAFDQEYTRSSKKSAKQPIETMMEGNIDQT